MAVQKQFAALDGYSGKNAPDVGIYELEKQRLVIHPDAVIVRSKNGDIISRYRDDKWETRHYGSPWNLNFQKFNKDKEDVKKLIYAVLLSGGTKSGTVTGSQLHSLHRTLGNIYFAAQKVNYSLKSALGDKEFMMDFSQSIPNTISFTTLATLKYLEFVGLDVGIDVPLDSRRNQLLNEKGEIARGHTKQIPLTPPEIYSEAFRQRWSHFERIEKNLDKLVGFIAHYASNPYFGRIKKDKYRKNSSKMVPFEDAVEQYDLWETFEYYHVSDHTSLEVFINSMLVTCGHLIAATTGMRAIELKMLEQGCFTESSIKRPAIINGWESKSNGGVRKPQDWITSPDNGRVVNMLEKLGSALSKGIILSEPNEIPLFVAVKAMYPIHREGQVVHNITIVSNLDANRELLLNGKELILSQEMMDSFLMVTHLPGRWDEEDKVIKVGKPWKFNWHQHRRMFAFLAVNSGLVRIPALQRQLSHTLQSVSAYYAGGALNLDPLITDGKNHITKEIIKERDMQAAIALTYHVIRNKAKIHTALDAWAKKMTNDDISIEEKVVGIKQLAKEVHKGNYHIKGTSVGSCIKPDACDSYLTFSFMDCGDCEYSNKDESRIENSIATTEQSIKKLTNMGYGDESYEMEAQKKELEYFKQQLIKAQKEESDELR